MARRAIDRCDRFTSGGSKHTMYGTRLDALDTNTNNTWPLHHRLFAIMNMLGLKFTGKTGIANYSLN